MILSSSDGPDLVYENHYVNMDHNALTALEAYRTHLQVEREESEVKGASGGQKDSS